MNIFPHRRPRRLRQFQWLRDLTSETSISSSDLIWPVFVTEGEGRFEEVAKMPQIARMSIDVLIEKCQNLTKIGLKAIAIFPVVDANLKDEMASESHNENNLCCRAIKELKKHLPNLGIIADVALDPYSSSGHDGIIGKNRFKQEIVLNDETIEILKKQALSLAKAGADIIAPSDMTDGRIGQIRKFLDQENFQDVLIMSYAAKFASSFYFPFRAAVGSDLNLAGANKKTYQMDFRNAKEAMLELSQDEQEAADILMVKPAGPYLDIIYRAQSQTNTPIFAYQVSGEYSMMMNSENAMELVFESLIAIKRAGATAILTYATPQMLEIFKQN